MYRSHNHRGPRARITRVACGVAVFAASVALGRAARVTQTAEAR